jgi:hypothetical protein
MPVDILQKALLILKPFCLLPGQNGQTINRLPDASDPLTEPGWDGVAKMATNVKRTKRTFNEDSSTGTNLWITRFRRFLGPTRSGLANVLLREVPPGVLQDAYEYLVRRQAETVVHNPVGYLCRLVGYSAKGGSNAHGKRKGPGQRAEPNHSTK